MKKELFLLFLAHNDDEALFFEALRQCILQKNIFKIFYLTCDFNYGSNDNIRNQESLKVLTKLGISREDIHFIGLEKNIADGELMNHLQKAYNACISKIENLAIKKIFTVAWEGGHHDHDATHLIAKAISKNLAVRELYEFSLYNSYKAIKGFFRVMNLPNNQIEDKVIRFNMNFKSALLNVFTLFSYKSQWSTFIGLSPGILIQFFIFRNIKCRKVSNRKYLEKPHEGNLLYETRFKIPHQLFVNNALPFISEHCLE